MKKHNLLLNLLFALSISFSACTKADYNDNVTKGDPIPVPGGFTNSSQVAASSLVGYWAFNGSLIDSVSGVSGVSTITSFGEGQKGQAMQGANNGFVITTPSDAIKSMTSYTFSFWVNSPLNVGATGLVSLGDTQNFWANINIFFENGGNDNLARFKTIYKSDGVDRDNNIQDVDGGFNKWVQYCITYDGAGTFKSFVNGSLARTNTVAGMGPSHFTNVGPLIFGTLHFMTLPNSSTSATTAQGWAGYLTGRLDEVRIYNKGLTETEVSALFKLEKQKR